MPRCSCINLRCRDGRSSPLGSPCASNWPFTPPMNLASSSGFSRTSQRTAAKQETRIGSSNSPTSFIASMRVTPTALPDATSLRAAATKSRGPMLSVYVPSSPSFVVDAGSTSFSSSSARPSSSHNGGS